MAYAEEAKSLAAKFFHPFHSTWLSRCKQNWVVRYQTHANRQRLLPHSTCQWLFVEQELLESIPFSSPGFLLLYLYGMPNFVAEHLGFLMCYVPGSQDLLQNCTTAKRFQSDFGNIWSSPNLPIPRNNLDRQ